MKNGYIFGLDGTLADSYKSLAASIEYVEQRAKAARETWADINAGTIPLEEAEELAMNNGDANQGLILEHYKETLDEAAEQIPQIFLVIQDLYERGAKLAVTSNKPSQLTETILRDMGIDQYFIGVYGPESVGEPKPHPAMIHRAIVDMLLRREEVLFVGDLALDIEMARAAGVRCAAIAGPNNRTSCAIAAPDFLLDDWSEILDLT
jgi:phosphoglycolate phosphatase